MEYRTLGSSGCAVSSLCLGTMTFGAETDEPGSHQQLDRFIEAGGNFVDTADVYAGGRSEEIIGRWFADRPADVTEPVVLATKGRFPRAGDDSPNGAGLSARHLTRALDASLRRLGRHLADPRDDQEALRPVLTGEGCLTARPKCLPIAWRYGLSNSGTKRLRSTST